MPNIPFNSPYLTGNEINYIIDAHKNGQLAGDGKYTKLCSSRLENILDIKKALITHSCTAALEMAALLLQVKEGDEIIMPSYTFVSTANAFVLRGAVPVFIDVDDKTFNIDPDLIHKAITSATKAIVIVHYAGVSCDLDKVRKIADQYGLPIVEDAAQAFLSTYKQRFLGSFGDLSAFSFHETKNIISGEGGALIINALSYEKRAEIIREKGTNRTQFFRGEIDKYTWVDKGSSYLPGELICAFLYAQLEDCYSITKNRINIWQSYFTAFESLEDDGFFVRQSIPEYSTHNGHMFFIVLNSQQERFELIKYLKSSGIQSVFHYVPLHTSPAGIKYGRSVGSFSATEIASSRLLRLPMGCNINPQRVIKEVIQFYSS